MNKEEFKKSFGHYPFEKPSKKSSKTPRSKKVSTSKAKSSMTSKEFTELSYENMSEEEHQREFVIWLDTKRIYFEIGLEGIFLPNPHPKNSRAFAIQSASNLKVLSKMKAQGLRRGPADIKVYLPEIVLHIELKRFKGGKESADQHRVKKIIDSLPYSRYEFARGYKQAVSIVLEYLNK